MDALAIICLCRTIEATLNIGGCFPTAVLAMISTSDYSWSSSSTHALTFDRENVHLLQCGLTDKFKCLDVADSRDAFAKVIQVRADCVCCRLDKESQDRKQSIGPFVSIWSGTPPPDCFRPVMGNLFARLGKHGVNNPFSAHKGLPNVLLREM